MDDLLGRTDTNYMHKQILLLGVGMAVLVAWLYQPMLPAHFVSDDYYLWKVVRELSFNQSFRLFIPPLLGGINVIQHTGHYAPLSAWVVWLNTVPLHMHPYPAHSISLFLHIVNMCLTGVFCFFVTHDKKAALLSAFIFGLFPYIAETVTYMSAVMFLLATMFYLLAFTSLSKLSRSLKEGFHSGSSKIWLFLHYCFFYFALLSAEIAITLPIATLVFLSFAKKKNPITVLVEHKIFFLGYLVPIVIYLFLWTLTLGTLNIFNSSGRFELNSVSRIFLYYLGALLLLVLARLKFAKMPGYLKKKERSFWLFITLIGITWLPTAKFFTQQRYLYLPVIFASLGIAYLFINIYISLSLQWLKGAAFIGLSFVLMIQSWFVYQSSLTWLNAGETARLILIQLSQKLQNRRAADPVYLINIPDSIDGAYVHRSYFVDAFEFETGKSPPPLIFTPMTVGLETHAKIIAPNLMELTSQDGFILFKPTRDPNGKRLLEWPKVYRAFETDFHTLDIEFEDPEFLLHRPQIYVFTKGNLESL